MGNLFKGPNQIEDIAGVSSVCGARGACGAMVGPLSLAHAPPLLSVTLPRTAHPLAHTLWRNARTQHAHARDARATRTHRLHQAARER